MSRVTTVLFRSRILGFVPGWLALILVLGGTAAATAPVFNGKIFSGAGQGAPPGFIGTYAYGTSYAANIFYDDTANGGIASLNASRTSDQPGTTPTYTTSMGTENWCLNDNSHGGFNCRAEYGEARSYANATPGPSITSELEATEFGTSQFVDPYAGFNGYGAGHLSADLMLKSGGECYSGSPLSCPQPQGGTAFAQPASVALEIGDNGNTFKSGIVFAHDALYGDDGKTAGQTASAITFAAGHMLVWDVCDNQTSYPNSCSNGLTSSLLYSSVNTPSTTSADMLFDSSGVLVQPHGSNTQTAFRVKNGAVVAGSATAPTSYNYGDLVGSHTASAGVLRLGGTSAAGTLDFGSTTANVFTLSAQENVNGAVVSGYSTAPASINPGDLAASESATCGILRLGGSSQASNINYGCTHAGAFTISAWTYLPSTFIPTTIGQPNGCTNTACRQALVSGAYTWTFTNAYSSTPSCVVSGEGALPASTVSVRVTSVSASAVTVSAYTSAGAVNTADTSTVDIHCLGNPN